MTTVGHRRPVLVTGASGCIGQQVLPQLVDAGWDVHAMTSRVAPPAVSGVTWHRADLLVEGEGAHVCSEVQAEALMHLAWYVAPGRWAAAAENIDWTAASMRLVRAFVKAGGSRIVVAGSGLEYDWAYGYCSELRTPCQPHTLYGASKHALHLMAERYLSATACSLAWARIFFVYGPFEHPDRLVPAVIRPLLAGERARCSHGRQLRDYLYAGDVADALVALLGSGVTGAINVASGQPITIRALATRAAQLVGRPYDVDFGAVPGAPTDAPVVLADTRRLQDELGWSPRHTLDDGLERTIDWWRHAEQRLGTGA